jgi:sugar phosphate isomerase/epimerase
MSPHTQPARRLGVCSWSLKPRSLEELVQSVRTCGVDAVQLSLAALRLPAFDPRRTAAALRDAGIDIRSGMTSMRGEDYSTLDSIQQTGGLRPDAHWRENLAIVKTDAATARALGLGLVTFHAGFLPHEASDPERAKLVERLRTVVDVFADHGVRVGFETGQETAETLLAVLHELGRTTAGVNFDPANMILYGMGDPVAALAALGPRVLQVHVKDARAATKPGEWGTEVVVGTGQVDWTRFFTVLDGVQPAIDLMIEREAGADRVAEIRAARDFVRARTAVGA